MLEVRLLGEVRLSLDGADLEPPASRRARLLLAMLVLERRRHPRGTLAARLWPDVADASARVSLRTALKQLRSALGPAADAALVVTREHVAIAGALELWVDVEECERLLAAGAAERAADLAAGTLLDGIDDEWVLDRRDGLRDGLVRGLGVAAATAERRGDGAEAIRLTRRQIELDPLGEAPLRELVSRLAAGGDRAGAVAAYDRFAERLRVQLRTAPSAATRSVVQELRGGEDRAAAGPEPAANAAVPAGPASPETQPGDRAPAAPPSPSAPAVSGRRRVSIVDGAVAGLEGDRDPEVAQNVLSALAARCRATVERHGGRLVHVSASGFTGAFGLEQAHEDDPLRAVRAAIELVEDVAALDAGGGPALSVGLGLEDGVLAVGDVRLGAAFASGPSLGIAAALAARAAPGELLMGPELRARAGGLVATEAAGPGAWRVTGAVEERVGRRASRSPFVGRDDALSALGAALEETVARRSCTVVTVLGPPGIGKSRLLTTFAAGLGPRVTVATARCPPYGEASALRPLAEVVRGLPEPVEELLAPEPGGGLRAQRIAAAVGEAGDLPGSLDETFAAFRVLFERLAAARPLVLVVEDVHWAQPTLLELIEHLATFSAGQPILVACPSRPDLREHRPEWFLPLPGRLVVELGPLGETAAGALVQASADRPLSPRRAREVVALAEGNPLFLEHLAAVADEREDELPSTVSAVLAERIDRLAPAERTVLELASVEGQHFHAGTLADLARGGVEPAPALLGLVRKELLRPAPPEHPGQSAFRFTHALLRDVAYSRLTLAHRAELHERVGAWLEGRPAADPEAVGHHLASAVMSWRTLGRTGARETALAARAAEHLGTAAGSASYRGDPVAAARLLERARTVVPSEDAGLVHRLAVARFESGELAEAGALLEQAGAAARRDGDAGLGTRIRVDVQQLRVWTQAGALDEAERVTREVLPVLAARGDGPGQCRAWNLAAAVHWTRGHVAQADADWEHAAACAKAAGDERGVFDALSWRAAAAVFGPRPVPDGIAFCVRARERLGASRAAEALVLRPQAALHAMLGEHELAAGLLAEARGVLADLGSVHQAVSTHEALAWLLAGRPDAAERCLRPGFEALIAAGERWTVATTAAQLAQAVLAQDRPAEAEELCRQAAELASPDDVATHVMWRGVHARTLSLARRHDEAVAVAREAVVLAEATDFLTFTADAWLDLAKALRGAGAVDEADDAIGRASEVHERKGDVVGRARSRSSWADRARTGNGDDASLGRN